AVHIEPPLAAVPAPPIPPVPQRRLIPPPSAPGSRRRLARHSLAAGIKAMAQTWAGEDSNI
ncbi:MAG TPA: hypothetical protein VGF91_32830, partial [Solirubrobacteraceae bacterium]